MEEEPRLGRQHVHRRLRNWVSSLVGAARIPTGILLLGTRNGFVFRDNGGSKEPPGLRFPGRD